MIAIRRAASILAIVAGRGPWRGCFQERGLAETCPRAWYDVAAMVLRDSLAAPIGVLAAALFVAVASFSRAAEAPVHECGSLAAHPLDPNGVTAGVATGDIDRRRAFAACRDAVRDFPATLRFQYQLGRLLGEAGEYDEALAWSRKAAQRGYAGAQYNLGVHYYEGWGVPRLFTEAMRWFEKAAEQGHAPALANLGAMYFHARGAKRNYVQAHLWLSLAARHGDPEAATQRDHVATFMTADAIAEAEALARSWRPKPAETRPPFLRRYTPRDR